MSNHEIVVGDEVWYYEWVPGQESHNKYLATVRVLPGDKGHAQHPKIHLRYSGGETNRPFTNANNILNEEIAAPDGDLTGINYWRFKSHVE